MPFHTVINNTSVEISDALLKKYSTNAPRYTSYPTAPVWTSSFGPDDFAKALAGLNAQKSAKLSLYFHIPFCKNRCHFCGCSTIITSHREVADRYVEALTKEIAIVSGHLKSKPPAVQLHLGGGTPTYLSCKQLEKLWRAVDSVFKIRPDAEIAIEAAPNVTTFEHLELLGGLGFNRLSLGIQDFSPKVQKAIGRIEGFDKVAQVIEKSRHFGLKGVNIDLVYGLPYQTLASFKDTVEKVIRLSPDRVACFNFAYLPRMLPHQRYLSKEALPSPDEKFAIFCQTIQQFREAGYEFIGMDHFAKKDDALAVAARKKTLWRNFQGYTTRAGTDLIAFGLTSISDFMGCYAQNEKKLVNYNKAIDSGRLATAKGWKLSDGDMARRKIIRELFCNGAANLNNGTSHLPPHPRRAGAPPTTKPLAPEAHPPLAEAGRRTSHNLQQDGLIQIKDDVIQVTPLGRLFIRKIAAAFDEYLKIGDTKFSRTV